MIFKYLPPEKLFTLNGISKENVDCFAYLGSQITPDGGTGENIKHRIRKV